LKQEKVLTPRADQYRQYGTYKSEYIRKYPYDWAPQSILHILCNEEYTGKIICNKHQTSSFKSKKLKQNPKSNWIVSTNMHEPIVDKEVYDKVQNLMLKKKKTTVVQHENIFKGKLRCNECGKTFSLAIRLDRGGHRSFACSTYRCDTSRCTSHYIIYDYLKSFLTSKINEMIEASKIGRSEFVKKYRKAKAIDKQIIELNKNIEISTQRLSEVDGLTKKLFEKYVSDKISEDRFYELDKSFDLEKVKLVKYIRECDSKIIELNKEETNIETFYDLISKHEKVVDLQRKDITSLVDKVVIHEKKNKKKKRIVEVYFMHIGLT
jgi:hypothetical protein